ncbi:MAG: XrtA/PEP-CTERM system TPR-repeat protein PrsT [Pseudomonadota bacterium]
MNRFSACMLVVGVMAGGLLSGCGIDTRSAAERVSEAQKNIEMARYREAIIDLRDLLLDRPDELDARLTLGHALIAIGDMDAAEKELERSRLMGAPADEFLESLIYAWQSRGNHFQVLAEARPDLMSTPDKGDIINALRARSLLALSNTRRASEIFDELLDRRSPLEAKRIALIGQATMAENRGDVDTAEKKLRLALELVPDSAETFLTLGRVYLDQERYQAAIDVLINSRNNEMKARRKDWFFIEAQLAEAYIGVGDLESAREATRTLEVIGEAHPMTAYLRGRVALETGDLPQAMEEFEQVLDDFPSFAPALTLLGVTLLELDDIEQAEMVLSEAVIGDPKNKRIRRLLAETRMRMGRSRAAISTLEDGVRNNSVDAPMITLLGRESLRIGARKEGLRYLRQALAEDPTNLRANLALAQQYLADGQTDAAVAVLQALPTDVIPAQRRALLIRVAQIDRSDVATAKAQIDALLRDTPYEPFLMSLAGNFYLTIGELGRAKSLFNQVLQQVPGNRSAMLSLLEVDEQTGDFSRSRELFRAANAAEPDDLLPLMVLARIEAASGDEAAAIPYIRQALDKHPTALLPNLIMGAHAMRTDELELAEQLARVAVERYDDSARAHALLGLIRMRQSRFDEASGQFRRAVLHDPADAEYRYLLGQADLAIQRARQARTHFKDALARDENHMGALRALAVMDARRLKNGLANQYVNRIRTAYGDSWAATVAVADIRAAQKNTAEALTLYQRALAEQPNWPISLELFRLRKAEGRTNPDRSLLEWLAREPDHLDALITLAQFREEQDDFLDAIGFYERALKIRPRHKLAANNIAWLYLRRDRPGDRALALDAARKAYRAEPGNIEIADTYGWMLHQNNEQEIAIGVFRAAMATTTAQKNPEIAYHFASALFNNQRPLQARDLLDEALLSDESFVSRPDAPSLA